jgi:hypothetical protein
MGNAMAGPADATTTLSAAALVNKRKEEPQYGVEELKAWSQNLGHEEDVMTTLRSYGEVPSPRQAEIIRNLHQVSEPDMDAAAALKALETIVRRTTSGFAAAQNLGARKSD